MATVQLFSQVASIIDRNIVKAVARECGSDKYAKTIDTWTHLVSMVFCQLADCQSLRDIELGMKGIRRELGHLGIRKAPSRNALSQQNRRRNPWVADRGYDDSRLWRDWDSMGVTFVVRLRRDIKFRRTEAIGQPDDREQDILVDEVIRLTGDDTERQYPHPLRQWPFAQIQPSSDLLPTEKFLWDTCDFLWNSGNLALKEREVCDSLSHARTCDEISCTRQHLRQIP